jgi:class 3 adenylate cyclase
LVIWPLTKEKDVALCRRAIQCAQEIQDKSKNNIANLSVKIGIGFGEFKIAFMGGQFSRSEYLVIGEGMKQACESETHAQGGGEIICSNDVYKHVKESYDFSKAEGAAHGYPDSHETFWKILAQKGTERVQTKADAFTMRTKFENEKIRNNSEILRRFVPAAITLHLDIDQEFWAKELRMISVMFLLLGVDLKHTETTEGMARVQKIVKTIQRCVYRTTGSLNKFLMDDKGSVMLMCWGLPPYSSTDDHLRSVICGFELIRELKKENCKAHIGISTGSAFSGICGTVGNRKEYSLLGEIVNLSARNMQKAIEINIKKKEDYRMLVCKRTAEVIIKTNNINIKYFISYLNIL